VTGKSQVAEQALVLIQKLYAIEAELRKKTDGTAEQRREYRQQHSQPVMQQLYEWLTQALDNAWRCRAKPTGVIFHTDQGSQYKSHLYRHRLQQYAMVQSMSRKGLAQYTAHGIMHLQKGYLEVLKWNGYRNLATTPQLDLIKKCKVYKKKTQIEWI